MAEDRSGPSSCRREEPGPRRSRTRSVFRLRNGTSGRDTKNAVEGSRGERSVPRPATGSLRASRSSVIGSIRRGDIKRSRWSTESVAVGLGGGTRKFLEALRRSAIVFYCGASAEASAVVVQRTVSRVEWRHRPSAAAVRGTRGKGTGGASSSGKPKAPRRPTVCVGGRGAAQDVRERPRYD